MAVSDELQRYLARNARPIEKPADYAELLAHAARAEFVLLGEGTHGTAEFYRERALLTRALIEQHQFQAIAVEADWPDAYRLNRFVAGSGSDANATEALADFERFPTWMWRNTEVRDFIAWLAAHNRTQGDRVGFFGLDLYSMYRSIDAVLRYLDRVDPSAAQAAREHYACFDHFSRDTEHYARFAASGLHSCERDVVRELEELRAHASRWREQHPEAPDDELFSAEQNARVVKNAEEYYRSLLGGRVLTWNLRDQHMLETLTSIGSLLERQGRPRKVVVWAHNSHLGDARATDMARAGELNLGQLVREHFPGKSYSVGFTTHAGTVTAASDWDLPGVPKALQPALPDSYEAAFHDFALPHFGLLLDGHAEQALGRRLERAVGVVYRPDTERISHYFSANLALQFNAIIHVDTTRAVDPLDDDQPPHAEDAPETYPFADDAGA
jgi:erythromycin esterase-like protein